MEFITEADYIRIQGLQRPDISSSTKAFILAANSFVTDWLNFESDSGTIELFNNRVKYFLSPGVSSIDSITDLNGIPVNTSVYTYLGDGVLYFTSTPPAGMYRISVTTGSFNGGTVPDSIKQAVVMLVEHWEKKDYRESRSFGGETVQMTTKTTGIPSHIRSILELYRNY